MLPDIVSHSGVRPLIRRALREDVGPGDATSLALIPARSRAVATILSREPAVMSGLPIAVECFRQLDPGLKCRIRVPDGARVKPGETVLELKGSARAILTAERVALNFLQRLSGIATLTAQFVEAVRGRNTQILDTRKTTPGLRALEKYAVCCGGGHNHRFGLYDRILIKDNHRRFWSGRDRSLGEAVRVARRRFPDLRVEIEVETLDELRDALAGGPDWVLLDNMSAAAIRRCVAVCRGSCRIEVSGGISLETIGRLAATGVDAVSIGRLTHSAPSVDLSLEFA